MTSPYKNTFLFVGLLILLSATVYAVDDDQDHLRSTFTLDYQRMISTFKIFPYQLNLTTLRPSLSATSRFHSSLLSSDFITANPADANLFYLPIPPDLAARSLDRLILKLRSSFPFWNRSLGADHFFLSTSSLNSSARNVVELWKNAVRVACFPSPAGFFVPHKDVSLPPIPPMSLLTSANRTLGSKNYKYLGYLRISSTVVAAARSLIGLRADPAFLISVNDDGADVAMRTSRFCLFWYGEDEMAGLGEALAQGCVPVVITDRPIQDMPLMDALKWEEIALFVGAGVGPTGLKRTLNDVAAAVDKYERMKRLGVATAHHLTWNHPPKPYDAFHMVVYQLWLRRHTVRYATSDMR